MKKLFLPIIIVVVTFATITFINSSNDHLECEEVKQTTQLADGKIETISKHICKEKINF